MSSHPLFILITYPTKHSIQETVIDDTVPVASSHFWMRTFVCCAIIILLCHCVFITFCICHSIWLRFVSFWITCFEIFMTVHVAHPNGSYFRHHFLLYTFFYSTFVRVLVFSVQLFFSSFNVKFYFRIKFLPFLHIGCH